MNGGGVGRNGGGKTGSNYTLRRRIAHTNSSDLVLGVLLAAAAQAGLPAFIHIALAPCKD